MKEMYLAQSDIYTSNMDGSVRRYHHNYCVYSTEEEAVKWLKKINQCAANFGNNNHNENTLRFKNRFTGDVCVYYVDKVPLAD